MTTLYESEGLVANRLVEALEKADARAAHLESRLQTVGDALEDMVWQFACRYDDPPRMGTAGLSALENAFEVLGWDDPHPTPEIGCQSDGCTKTATSGSPTPEGYKWLCSVHFRMVNPPELGE